MEIIISMIILFFVVAILVTIHCCVVRWAFSDDLTAGRPSSAYQTPSMKPEEIKKLPCFDYKAEEEKEMTKNSECAVCLEIFAVGEKCRILPKCNHSFHAKCIDSWLLKTAACPVCRASVNSSHCIRIDVVEVV
ncbi:hypothetical protein SASPL_157391 [Salvia splendens]|uniref:RING-type domain-containing protein n=1 Tax=Salvia splendens TaxID=180675 RepID=A0A8X8YWG1_SALSN|nr:hypothetical protein SASPL_157391 [Salvia splendens]